MSLYETVQFKASDAVPPVIVDIGITIDDEFNPLTRQTEAVAKVADVGDLHTYGAFQDVDARGVVVSGAEVKIDQRIPMEAVDALLKKK